MVTFVIFHANIPSKSTSQEEYHSHLIARQSYDFEQLCDITFRSAALFHPGCRKVLLTDTVTQFQLDPSVEIIRREINPQNMMFERMHSQLNFLQEYDFQNDLFFLDSDMIVNASWSDILKEKFDIGLTYEIKKDKKIINQADSLNSGQVLQESKHGYMPINGGVIIVQKGSAKNSLTFFEDMLRNYTNDSRTENIGWWGDQHALINTVGVDNFLNRTSDTINVGPTKIRLLPTQIYNFPPPKKAYHSFRSHKAKLLHFRGERKALMIPYWEAYLKYKETDMKRTFASSLKGKVQLYIRGVQELVMPNIHR